VFSHPRIEYPHRSSVRPPAQGGLKIPDVADAARRAKACRQIERSQSHPSWLNLVRRSAGVVDRAEGLAQVVGERVGGGDGVRPGLDLDGAVAAGGLDELSDRPAGPVLDRAADRERREDDGQVRFDRVLVRW
jgi:hypothetical protein